MGCDSGHIARKNVSGRPGDVVVVIPKETWDGATGAAVRAVLQRPQVGLPQDEPLFSLISIPPIAFKDIFKTNRNILQVRISPTTDTARVEFKRDVWAWPQAVVNILAKSQSEFIELFQANSEKIVSFLLKAERERLQMAYSQSPDKVITGIVKEKFGIGIDIPVGFKVALDTGNFLWVRYDTPKITQNVMIYSYPYVSDSTFTERFMLDKRDSVVKVAHGAYDDSYMVTERRIPACFSLLKYHDCYASELRTLWRMDGHPGYHLGGPFVSLSILDPAEPRIITVEGSVVAAGEDKRNYMRQLEAIAYSLRFHNSQSVAHE
jgi:hypothetical protein